MPTTLLAEAVHKGYTLPHHRVEVLHGASLQVAAGERLAIVGRSGAGKSTLLHLLGGLDRPDAGRVIVRDVDLYALSPSRRSAFRARQIGFVFQSYHLLPEMDIVENVLLPALALGVPIARARKRARALLDHVGLGERLGHTPVELSGGEQQRVAMARALMNEPPLVLADEPTGNLDAATGAEVIDTLFGLAGGHALVLVTHSPVLAARCDRTVRLEDGRLTLCG